MSGNTQPINSILPTQISTGRLDRARPKAVTRSSAVKAFWQLSILEIRWGQGGRGNRTTITYMLLQTMQSLFDVLLIG